MNTWFSILEITINSNTYNNNNNNNTLFSLKAMNYITSCNHFKKSVKKFK